MIVFHGTGQDRLTGLLESGPRISPRLYLKGKRAFSTTKDFEIATLFALRRSPQEALKDERFVGVVLEYEVARTSKSGKDWTPAKDSGILQDEAEIAVFKPSVLTLQAVWRLLDGKWNRYRKDEGSPVEVEKGLNNIFCKSDFLS